MHLFTLGLNHQTAPVDVREKVAFPAETMSTALSQLLSCSSVAEAAIVSTCNRTEIYCKATDIRVVAQWLADYHKLPLAQIEPYLYALEADQAVRHSFRVAAGLDSMVLGEAQILGQFKDAVRQAQTSGSLGSTLNALFQRTFSVAKEVRSTTEIGANSVSMAAAAVRLAERIFPSVKGLNVLFIGAGEMIELVATYFAAEQPQRITVANRTIERAQALASRFNGSAIALADLPAHLASHDIIVSSTASPLPILGKGMVERALKQRKWKPIFIVDLAVPRDVEPEVDELDDVYLYTVDDLSEVVQEGRSRRSDAVTEAEAIIDGKVTEFMSWAATRNVVPVIRALRERADEMRRGELERAQKMLDRGEDPKKVLEALSAGLTNKFLHIPTHVLNNVTPEQRDEVVNFISRMYNIHGPDGGH